MSDHVAPVVPQRLTLVLPSTGAFDSRTWRIAGSLAARGHQVTVVARRGEGLPNDEMTATGYRVLRVPVDAVDGLPGPLRSIARRVRGRRPSGARGGAGDAIGRVDAMGGGSDASRGRIGRVRRAAASGWRIAAIALTTRSQRLATRRVAPPADLVHAMAYMGIPVGLDLGRRDRAPVVYDARDIYVDARNIARLPGPARRLFARIERGWARRADRVITVNGPYADVMAHRFGVPRPLVVLNCSVRADAPVARGRRFHDALGLPDDRRVVLYHGGLSPDRGIEQLLEAIPAIRDATLVLMGYGDLEATIRARAAGPDLAGRVAVLPAVPPAELTEWVGSADVAAMPIQPTTLNHRLTTPNKLFEAIAAGVPVVASDLPGMAPIVCETGCGITVDPTDAAAIAAAIEEILDGTPARRAAIRDGLARARDTYTWERQAEILVAEYGRLTGRPW
jgi:glycosyltransferase involved in cell wall biosynthesis